MLKYRVFFAESLKEFVFLFTKTNFVRMWYLVDLKKLRAFKGFNSIKTQKLRRKLNNVFNNVPNSTVLLNLQSQNVFFTNGDI